MNFFQLDRISRVVAIRDGETRAAATGLAVPPAGPPRTTEELDKARNEYISRWLRELP